MNNNLERCLKEVDQIDTAIYKEVLLLKNP